jgi:hypothetical protein
MLPAQVVLLDQDNAFQLERPAPVRGGALAAGAAGGVTVLDGETLQPIGGAAWPVPFVRDARTGDWWATIPQAACSASNMTPGQPLVLRVRFNGGPGLTYAADVPAHARTNLGG